MTRELFIVDHTFLGGSKSSKTLGGGASAYNEDSDSSLVNFNLSTLFPLHIRTAWYVATLVNSRLIDCKRHQQEEQMQACKQ